MEDINKQIEEEAIKILERANKLPPEANYFGSVDHIKYSANDIIILLGVLEKENRWRKVEEELPEYGERVLIKPKNDLVIVGWLKYEEYFETYKIDYPIKDVESWKPIH